MATVGILGQTRKAGGKKVVTGTFSGTAWNDQQVQITGLTFNPSEIYFICIDSISSNAIVAAAYAPSRGINIKQTNSGGYGMVTTIDSVSYSNGTLTINAFYFNVYTYQYWLIE